MEELFKKQFLWFVPNDDNRVEDSRELRCEFLDTAGLPDDDRMWMDLDSSVFELIIGVARRAAFETDGEVDIWFWQLMDNLGLRSFTDEVYMDNGASSVNDILETLINRTYSRDGHGGLFPLKHPRANQRNVEIWYQMSAYLLEQND